VIPLDRIKTDPVRLTALPAEWKEFYNESWMTHYGGHPLTVEPEGYIAPPLDGVWATAPYFHNGSVPTLYHVFNPDERPDIWTRDMDGYDKERVGLVIQEHDSIPEGLTDRQRRAYFDTSVTGAGNQGHYFPDERLDPEEKTWLIEYLKTL